MTDSHQDQPVSVTSRGRVTIVTIQRPQVRNAIDRETAQALADAFRHFDTDDDADVAVLAGAGGTFCAGADLKAVAAGRPNRLESEGDAPLGPTRMLLQKPVIAAISGHAVAGGMELALWCDLRVMEEDAVMGFFERRWGVPLIDGGTVRLPRLIGLSRAMELILTGRSVDAKEAHHIGMVHRVVAPGGALEEAITWAEELAQFPQTCMRHDRLSAYEQFGQPLDEAIKNEFRHGQHALTEETLLGATKFAKGAGRHGSFAPEEGEE